MSKEQNRAYRCVKALKGLNPEAVPGLVKALEYYSNKEKHDSGGIVDETTPANTGLAAAKEGE